MKKTKRLGKFLYHHTFIRYVFVGGSTFLIDFSLLIFSHEMLHLHLAVATTLAYWTSIVYNFYLNRWWSFSASDKDKLSKHALLYGSLLGFNYLFTLIFVSVGSHFINYQYAKILAIGISVSWTYLLYKNVIFRKTEQTKPIDS